MKQRDTRKRLDVRNFQVRVGRCLNPNHLNGFSHGRFESGNITKVNEFEINSVKNFK